MKPLKWFSAALLAGFFIAPAEAPARAFSVTVRTDRGNDAVYRPGEALRIEARTSHDAYMLVYEIDAEGFVHVLFPHRRMSAMVEGGRPLRLPEDGDDLELVAQEPVGQGYIVAIASVDPFADMPWYLRPYDAREEEIGYHGSPEDEEEGVTSDGRIVGDPFVAMERIRRRVLADPDDLDGFATAYASYYVHTTVRYPRYLCYDCHRPGRWQWWDGFDPYYTSCSVFDFRVNWSWWWGPRYWGGYVPYYVYVYRDDCPPRYRAALRGRMWHSSWDGWKRWNRDWGARLTRYKSPPPPGYQPPGRTKFVERGRGTPGGQVPPGFIGANDDRRGRLARPGRSVRDRVSGSAPGDRRATQGSSDRGRRAAPDLRPGRDGDDSWRRPSGSERPRRDGRPQVEPRGEDRPGREPRSGASQFREPRYERGSRPAPEPAFRPGRDAAPSPRPSHDVSRPQRYDPPPQRGGGGSPQMAPSRPGRSDPPRFEPSRSERKRN